MCRRPRFATIGLENMETTIQCLGLSVVILGFKMSCCPKRRHSTLNPAPLNPNALRLRFSGAKCPCTSQGKTRIHCELQYFLHFHQVIYPKKADYQDSASFSRALSTCKTQYFLCLDVNSARPTVRNALPVCRSRI